MGLHRGPKLPMTGDTRQSIEADSQHKIATDYKIYSSARWNWSFSIFIKIEYHYALSDLKKRSTLTKELERAV